LVADRYDWLRALDPKLIADCGANQGQWLAYARGIWPDARYVCFEPQGECASLIPRDDKVTVVEMAVGDRIGRVAFNRSSFNQSSSCLKMGQLHKDYFPFSAGESVCEVEMTTLDEFFDSTTKPYGCSGAFPDIVKLDLQGFELQALIHSPRVVMKAKAIVCETSFVELYEGQPLFGEIHDYMTQCGYRYAGIVESPLLSPIDGQPLEEDSWFIKIT
jgi:FkbM family methyltransferase